MRLNAYIASCGVSSRRKAEIIILEGRVQVNGKIVLAPFFQVDQENDIITLDKKKLNLSQHVYYVINKPSGYVCAASDKYDPVVIDLIQNHNERLYPVGRLDRDSEGLLILTNDGEFTQSILHPSKEIRKEYEALLNIPINIKQLERWRKGFEIPEGHHVKPLSINIIEREPVNQWVSIVIVEGLKREIRLMAKEAGFKVERLIRRKIGKMRLERLSAGEFVSLSFSDLYTKIFNGGIV
ncbi:MAG: rRNA pseudouridine synthase [Synergistaceae bacterium]|nr:rRNA pseudouridine synthase [Synergistaceae bacterium]MBQ9629161.1 rRNA pseudouridine synthase [Synergistaceae bacterium]MBR0250259.1 rRNA pseudouridine synthase [Synergistaceae bacterium]